MQYYQTNPGDIGVSPGMAVHGLTISDGSRVELVELSGIGRGARMVCPEGRQIFYEYGTATFWMCWWMVEAAFLQAHGGSLEDINAALDRSESWQNWLQENPGRAEEVLRQC